MKSLLKLYTFILFLPLLVNAQNNNQTDIFIRDSKLIYQDNFAKEKTGTLPADWTTNGMAILDTTYLAPGKWLKILKGSGITCNAKPLALPDSYTIEYEVIPQSDPQKSGWDSYGFTIMSTHKPEDLVYGYSRPGDAGIKFDFGMYNYYNTYYDDGALPMKGSTSGIKTLPKQEANHLYKMAFSIDKTRITVWRDDTKIFDLPEAMDLNYKYNMLRFENGTAMIRNFRVATK